MEGNKLYNDDCLKIIKNISDNSIDLVVTDCPYKIVSGGCTNKNDGNGIFKKESASSGKLFKNNDIEFSEWLPEVYRILKDGTHCYIMVNARNLKKLQMEAEKVGFKFQNLLVWVKNNKTPNRYYMGQCEFIIMLKKGKARTINYPGCGNVISIENNVGKKKHPTEKPVELMKYFITNSSNDGEIVVDPFMGSGSTGIACIEANRRFIGIEINPDYFDIAAERMEIAMKESDHSE